MSSRHSDKSLVPFFFLHLLANGSGAHIIIGMIATIPSLPRETTASAGSAGFPHQDHIAHPTCRVLTIPFGDRLADRGCVSQVHLWPGHLLLAPSRSLVIDTDQRLRPGCQRSLHSDGLNASPNRSPIRIAARMKAPRSQQGRKETGTSTLRSSACGCTHAGTCWVMQPMPPPAMACQRLGAGTISRPGKALSRMDHPRSSSRGSTCGAMMAPLQTYAFV